MKSFVLAAALAAVLVSPALAEEPLNPNDPYNTNEAHLSAQSREIEQGIPIQTSPQAGTTDWEWGPTNGLSNPPYEPYYTDHQHPARRER